MPNLLLVSIISIFFIACSSEEPDALNEWFNDHGFASSYGRQFEEVKITVKNVVRGHNDSAYFLVDSYGVINSYAALGNVNGIEHSLYFDLETESPPSVLKFRPDTVFYKNFPKSTHQMDAKIYWLKEAETKRDSVWLASLESFENYTDTKSANTKIEWKDNTLQVDLPEEIQQLERTKLLMGIKFLSDVEVLRIDISNLPRVAQKSKVLDDDCKKCLHAGIRESLSVSFEAGDIKNFGKPVVFAQLLLPEPNDTTGSELGLAVPVYAYSEKGWENYRVDTAYVEKHGHPNLVFWKNEELKIQVTSNLRNYVAPAPLNFTLRLGNPVLEPESLYFYTLTRPAYSRYDFSSSLYEGATATLKIWFADFGDKK